MKISTISIDLAKQLNEASQNIKNGWPGLGPWLCCVNIFHKNATYKLQLNQTLRKKAMVAPTDNETWLIDRGDEIIEKKVGRGIDGLSVWERLVYCLWVADYGIRNAGDLDIAEDLHKGYRQEIVYFSEKLGFKQIAELFSINERLLVEKYSESFEGICSEVREGEPNA